MPVLSLVEKQMADQPERLPEVAPPVIDDIWEAMMQTCTDIINHRVLTFDNEDIPTLHGSNIRITKSAETGLVEINARTNWDTPQPEPTSSFAFNFILQSRSSNSPEMPKYELKSCFWELSCKELSQLTVEFQQLPTLDPSNSQSREDNILIYIDDEMRAIPRSWLDTDDCRKTDGLASILVEKKFQCGLSSMLAIGEKRSDPSPIENAACPNFTITIKRGVKHNDCGYWIFLEV